MDIPSLPTGMASIVSIATSDTATADDVAHAIMLDPALSTKVLRMANSAFYGRLTKAETVTQAVVTLGFSAVKTVALAASVVDHILPDEAIPGLSWRDFWQHCVATGAAAELISRQATGSKRGGESTFVAGLLHDVGKLVIAHNVPAEFARAVQRARDSDGELLNAERTVLGTDHATVGALLAQEWRLPEALSQPIGNHHSDQPADAIPPIVSAVRGANLLTKRMFGSYLLDCEFEVTFDQVAQASGLEDDDLQEVIDALPERLQECQEVMSWGGNLPEIKKAA